MFALALFIFLWSIRKRVKVPGLLFTFYVFLYSLGQFAIFYLRDNSITVLDLKAGAGDCAGGHAGHFATYVLLAAQRISGAVMAVTDAASPAVAPAPEPASEPEVVEAQAEPELVESAANSAAPKRRTRTRKPKAPQPPAEPLEQQPS